MPRQSVSPLRRRMIDDMSLRNLSPATQRSYLHAVSKFSRYSGRSPERLGLEDVRAFQVYLVAQGISWPALYIALGILPDGTKEILGIWIEQTEGAKFWLRVMNELKNRGVADILIADTHAPLTIKPNWLSTDEARKAMIELLR